MFCFILLVCCVSLGKVIGNPCKQDWEHFGDSCYAFGETAVSWAEAQDFCRSAGGKLAEIETSAENDFLKGEVTQRHTQSYWVGGTDVFHEGVWIWISTGELFIFKDWIAGEPGDAHGDEDCLCLWQPNSFQWGDLSCIIELYFICEAEALETVVG